MTTETTHNLIRSLGKEVIAVSNNTIRNGRRSGVCTVITKEDPKYTYMVMALGKQIEMDISIDFDTEEPDELRT